MVQQEHRVRHSLQKRYTNNHMTEEDHMVWYGRHSLQERCTENEVIGQDHIVRRTRHGLQKNDSGKYELIERDHRVGNTSPA